MDKGFDEEIVNWTKIALKRFDELGWFKGQDFSYFELNSYFCRDEFNLNDLNAEELEYLVECAIEDSAIYAMLEALVHDALEKSETIPEEILKFSAAVFCGNIKRPQKIRSNNQDMEDYTLLLLAEVIAANFEITTSRNDATKVKCAFDYIEKCLRDLKINNELSTTITKTFNSLSRLRASKVHVAQRVDQTLKLIGQIVPKS